MLKGETMTSFQLATKEEIKSFGFKQPLVNNFDLFHEAFPTLESRLALPDWSDNSDWSEYPHVDEVISNLTKVYSGKSITVRVPVSYIWSCDKTDGGFDRPRDVNLPSGIAACRKNLDRILDHSGTRAGFDMTSCGTLFAFARVIDGNKIVILKSQGNNRVVMKLLANRGEDAEVLMQIVFHDPDITDQKEWTKVEATNHYTDAEMRRGQNENDKFRAGYIAGDPKANTAATFLREVGFNYRNFWQDIGVKEIDGVSVDDLPSVNALTGLTSGEGNGWFRDYGRTNLINAFRVASKVMKITKEDTITSSAIAALAIFYKAMTEYGNGKGSEPLFTVEEINEFVIEFFKYKNQKPENKLFAVRKKLPIYGLCELTAASQLKNWAFSMAQVFWPMIRGYYQNIRDSRETFASSSDAGKYILSQCKVPYLEKGLRRMLDGESANI
jgi:hypothetical protein